MKVHMRACIAVLLGITLGAAAVRQTHAQGIFSGNWNTSTANPGWFYDLTLNQSGANVTGNYTVTTPGEQQGTTGQITGTVNGRTLQFTWTQNHRQQGKLVPNFFHGTAQFTLCADGNHIAGPYENSLPSPLTAHLWKGTWIGTRKGTAAGVEAKIANAYRTWLSSNSITNASLAVMQNGCLLGHYGFGNRRTTTVVPIASLTKAITAMCVANLVDAGKLSYTDKVSTRLSSFFKSTTIADKRASDITIEHLLRHTSGFPGYASFLASGKKTKSDPVPPPWAAGIPNTASADEAFAKAQLAQNLSGVPGTGTADYNNVNYALLGMIIKQVTGQTYEAYCKQTVLTPQRLHGFPLGKNGTDIHIGDGIPAMGAFGGWEMTVEQYADFIDTHYRKMSASADSFMNASFGARYGLGVQLKKTSKGRNVWHTGNWQSYPPTTPPGAFSSYFALWDNELLVVVAHDKALDDNQLGTLDTALVTAAGK